MSNEQNPKQDPAGDIELDDKDLEGVAGGATDEESIPTLSCTSEQTVCKGTCCVPFVGGCCEAT